MLDREKVINGLIACTSDDSQAEDEWHDCENCPYCDICATGNTGIGIPVMLDALALLKEREAVKTKSKSRHGEYPQIVHRCGNCNEILYRYYKYCPTCGRAVKWE